MRVFCAAFAGVSMVAVLAAVGFVGCGGETRPDIVLITIDTLRADRVGCYGYDAARTPTMDRLAKEGVRFEFCDSPIPVTLPAHASILTGLLPARHGVRNNLTYALPSEVPTLPMLLQEEGYRTGAFVSAFPVNARFGLGRGFHEYDDRLPEAADVFEFRERAGSHTVEAALAWLRKQPDESPVFLWVHLFEPHAPYIPPAPLRHQFAHPYDGEIAASDLAVGELLSSFEQLRSRDRVTAITSDHGEGLGEHGEASHSFFLYESTLRVPLILHAPGRLPRGGVVTEPVSLCDLAPTLLALSGSQSQLETDGIELRPGKIPRRRLVAETLYGMEAFGWSPMFSLRDGSHKVVRSAISRAFNLHSDPDELRDLLQQNPPWAAKGLARLDSIVIATGRTAVDAPRQPSPEEVEALAALGYVGGTSSPFSGGGESLFLEAMRELSDGTTRLDEIAEVTRANDHMQQERYDEAIAVLEGVLEKNLGNGWAHLLLARAYRKTGDLEAAVAALQESAARQPRRAETQLEIAHLQWRLGRTEEAIQHFDYAIQLEPWNLVMFRDIVTFFLEAERADLALDRIANRMSDVDALPPADQKRLYEFAARTCLRYGSPEPGVEYLKRARDLGDSAPLRLVQAQYHRARDQWREVLDLLIPLDPELSKNPQALLLVGLAYDNQGAFAEAVKAYRNVVELEEFNHLAHARLGWLLATRLNQPHKALAHGARAIELRPEQPEYHVVYIEILQRLGREKDAKAHLRLESSGLPDDPRLRRIAQQYGLD